MPPKKPAVDEQLRSRAEGRTYTTEELVERAGQLEAKVAQLRNRYEQYFIGLERKPPSNDRESLHKELEMLRQLSTKNTGLKFRLNSLFNRFLSYERLWLRTEKDIEEGRYRKDLFKARLRHRAVKPTPEDVDTSSFDDDTDAGLPGGVHAPQVAQRPGLPFTHPTPAIGAASPVPGIGPNDQRLRAIYDAFISAKRECRESVSGLTFEQVSARIQQQLPQLVQQTNAKAIDFKVVIKDGKATLRAIAKP